MRKDLPVPPTLGELILQDITPQSIPKSLGGGHRVYPKLQNREPS